MVHFSIDFLSKAFYIDPARIIIFCFFGGMMKKKYLILLMMQLVHLRASESKNNTSPIQKVKQRAAFNDLTQKQKGSNHDSIPTVLLCLNSSNPIPINPPNKKNGSVYSNLSDQSPKSGESVSPCIYVYSLGMYGPESEAAYSPHYGIPQ